MLLLVVNGSSGGGRGSRIGARTTDELRRRGVPHEIIQAASPEAASSELRGRLAAGAAGTAAPLSAVAVIGGDGTVHAVLPALAGTDVPLGVIPAGSGNDTVRAFRLPARPAAALDRMLASPGRAVDLIALEPPHGQDGGALALTALAVGFDAAVADTVNRAAYKRWCNRLGLGPLAYIIGILDRLRTYRPAPLTIVADGRAHAFGACWMAAVANMPSYGGGLRICPDADPADGRLDVCVVHGCTRLQLLMLFPTLLTGAHVRLPFVTLLRGAELKLLAGAPLPVVGDGEPQAASVPMTVRAVRHRIRLLV